VCYAVTFGQPKSCSDYKGHEPNGRDILKNYQCQKQRNDWSQSEITQAYTSTWSCL